MLFVLVKNCSSKLYIVFLTCLLLLKNTSRRKGSWKHAVGRCFNATMALFFIFICFSSWWFFVFNTSLVNLTLNLEFEFHVPYNVNFLYVVFMPKLSYFIVFTSGNLSYIDAVFCYTLFFNLNQHIWKEREFAGQFLLIVRTCCVFQSVNFLVWGCKNMPLIGICTWGFFRSCVLKHRRYILNIEWFFLIAFFLLYAVNSSKYATITSIK